MCGEDSNVMEQEGSKSKSRWVRLMVERYGHAAEEDEEEAIANVCSALYGAVFVVDIVRGLYFLGVVVAQRRSISVEV